MPGAFRIDSILILKCHVVAFRSTCSQSRTVTPNESSRLALSSQATRFTLPKKLCSLFVSWNSKPIKWMRVHPAYTYGYRCQLKDSEFRHQQHQHGLPVRRDREAAGTDGNPTLLLLDRARAARARGNCLGLHESRIRRGVPAARGPAASARGVSEGGRPVYLPARHVRYVPCPDVAPVCFRLVDQGEGPG